ncbi:MAG: L-2-hydroxyglutarate oxidase [Herpetosiphon sp.]
MARYHVVVVGAGIVGLAAARDLLLRYPHLLLAVIDKEPVVGHHQTGHNSGVIHAGLYYQPGSLKARLCVTGAAEAYRYCEANGIPAERCGKVVVATSEAELPRLHALFARGQANGVPGLELIDAHRLRVLEPHCRGVAAIWSPATGIVDWQAVARSYAADVQHAGGELLLGQALSAIRRLDRTIELQTPAGSLETANVVICGGLHADQLAMLSGAPSTPRVVPFRGDYYLLRRERRSLVRNLIYPVPDPAFPFLGVHFTRRTDGSVWLGPNAVLAGGREAYRRTDVNLRDLAGFLAFRGFRRLARRHWRYGLAELYRDWSKPAFLRSLQSYIPELTSDDLLPGPSGVRAQALDADGRLVDDFVVHTDGPRVLHVRNAPSPAATSSLAIGRLIAQTAVDTFVLPA